MLTRAECLKIMELPAEANSSEIETRYTLLLKRYRGQSDPATLARLDEITLAYKILTDRYEEPVPPDPRLARVVLGKTLAQWQNTWHYGRWPLLGAVVVAIFVIALVYSIASNKNYDFKVVAAGRFSQSDDATSLVQASLAASALPTVEKVEVQTVPLVFASADSPTAVNDSQNQYAFTMKLVTLIAADKIDVFICDEHVFEHYAPQGAFKDLSALYSRLQSAGLPAETLTKIKPLRRELAAELRPTTPSTAGANGSQSAGAETSADNAAVTSSASPDATDPAETALSDSEKEALNNNPNLPIYGLDVSALNISDALGLTGESEILTIGLHCPQVNVAEQWLAGLVAAGIPSGAQVTQ